MVNMAILTCCTGLCMPRTSSASMVHSQTSVDRILEKQAKADPKVLARCPQKFKWNRKISSHWWIFQDYRMHRETECSRIWRISIRCHSWAKPSDRERKLRCHNNSWWWRMAKAHFDVQRIFSAQKPRGFKAIRINWCRKRNWSSLKYWDCYNYWCSWFRSASSITEFTRILRMDFEKSWSRKICQWKSSSQLRRRELQFFVAGEGRQPQWCASRIFKNCRAKSRARLASFEHCKNEGWTFKHASGNRCLLDTGSPRPPRKAAAAAGAILRQYIRKQSPFTWRKRSPRRREFWLQFPGCPKCKRDVFETRISKCVTNMVRHHDQDERETDGARHWDGVLSALKGKFRNQLEKEFTDEDWLHCLYLGSIKTRFEICKDENGGLRKNRAIQGHSGGMIISLRLMNYVMIPYKWKRFIYHVGRAPDQYSIAEIGLLAGGKERE